MFDAAVTFQLSELEFVQELSAADAETGLGDVASGSLGELKKLNATLFTSGGSLPRNYWAESGLGARIRCVAESTGDKHDLVDLCSMTCNTILGVNDPWVKLKQLAFLVSRTPHHLPARIASPLTHRVARRILDCVSKIDPDGDFRINLRQCNGSDAVELALHVAWQQNSRRGKMLATFDGSYHGESVTASLVGQHDSAEGQGRALIEGLANVRHFPSPACDREGNLDATALHTLAELEEMADDFFAFLIEPVQWRNSVRAVPLEFLRRLRKICDAHQVCLIYDEVQNAFGYSGSIFYAESKDVFPDVIATGKALTSGHGALGIVVSRAPYTSIEAPFGGKTNSGDMLSLVAVDAVMDRLLGVSPAELEIAPAWLPGKFRDQLELGLLASVYPSAVARLDTLLRSIAAAFPDSVEEVTGVGLMRGLVLRAGEARGSGTLAGEISELGLRSGVYVRRAGSAVYFKPSLALTESDARDGYRRLIDTMNEVCA